MQKKTEQKQKINKDNDKAKMEHITNFSLLYFCIGIIVFVFVFVFVFARRVLFPLAGFHCFSARCFTSKEQACISGIRSVI